MSKNITVSEGNTARVFGNTKKLETKLQGEDAGTCFWVPEDETDAQPLYITENGLYEASEAGVYGFSEAHVNISKKVTDDDGTDWNIHIDDDGIPHITVGDPDDPYTGTDISIDDGTGDIDVHIPGNNPDDWPGWDDLDPDVKPEFDDWMDDPKIPGDWPGWDDLAPEIVDEFDNWLDDGNDPDLWPGWDDLDPDEKTDFDDWMDDPKDPDDWPGWEDIDPEIKTDFDDWTSDIDTEIDPDEAGLDPDEDVDTSFDPDEQDVDMVGTDGNGDDVKVNYDPKTGDYETEDCPEYIKIIHGPNNIENTGGPIDYDGLVVQAFDKNGNPWTNKDYPDGYIPLQNLNAPIKPNMDDAIGVNVEYGNGVKAIKVRISDCAPSGKVVIFGHVCHYVVAPDYYPNNYFYVSIYGGKAVARTITNSEVATHVHVYSIGDDDGVLYGTNYFPFSGLNQFVIPLSPTNPNGVPIENEQYESYEVPITIEWESPCFKTLTASFDIFLHPSA